jgi:hypothetical protein
MSSSKIPHIKSVETRYLQERDSLFRSLGSLDRRSFLKVSTGAAAAAVAAGVNYPFHSFLPISVAYADERGDWATVRCRSIRMVWSTSSTACGTAIPCRSRRVI